MAPPKNKAPAAGSSQRPDFSRAVADNRKPEIPKGQPNSNSNTSNIASDDDNDVVMPKANLKRGEEPQGQDNTTSLINFTHSYELDDDEDEEANAQERDDDESTLNGDNTNEAFSGPVGGQKDQERRNGPNSEEGYVAGEIINMNFDEMSETVDESN